MRTKQEYQEALNELVFQSFSREDEYTGGTEETDRNKKIIQELIDNLEEKKQ